MIQMNHILPLLRVFGISPAPIDNFAMMEIARKFMDTVDHSILYLDVKR